MLGYPRSIMPGSFQCKRQPDISRDIDSMLHTVIRRCVRGMKRAEVTSIPLIPKSIWRVLDLLLIQSPSLAVDHSTHLGTCYQVTVLIINRPGYKSP